MPSVALLFDAALAEVRRAYGNRVRSVRITIAADDEHRVEFHVPNWWEANQQTTHPQIPHPGAVAEILHVLVDVGHRLTRDEVIAELGRRKRRHASGIVGDTLSLLVKLGVLNNRQDVAPNGFGLPDWD